jgi:5-hydroxyisourate hydrolase
LTALTTHVLDTARGEPAAGVSVRLDRMADAGPEEIGRASTDADGRVRDLGPDRLEPGTYRLVFGTGEYLARTDPGRDGVFFPEVTVTFTVDGQAAHYHVPLLLSPFGYTTYRGS